MLQVSSMFYVILALIVHIKIITKHIFSAPKVVNCFAVLLHGKLQTGRLVERYRVDFWSKRH